MNRDYVNADEVQSVVDSFITEDMDAYERADAIYNWIDQNIHYGFQKVLNGHREYGTRTPQEIIADGEGICFEHASLFLAMAAAADIDTNGLVLVEDTDDYDYTNYHHFAGGLQDIEGTIYTYDTTRKEKGIYKELESTSKISYELDQVSEIMSQFEDRETEISKRTNNDAIPLKYVGTDNSSESHYVETTEEGARIFVNKTTCIANNEKKETVTEYCCINFLEKETLPSSISYTLESKITSVKTGDLLENTVVKSNDDGINITINQYNTQNSFFNVKKTTKQQIISIPENNEKKTSATYNLWIENTWSFLDKNSSETIEIDENNELSSYKIKFQKKIDKLSQDYLDATLPEAAYKPIRLDKLTDLETSKVDCFMAEI